MTSASEAAGRADESPALLCDCHFHIFGPADRFPYAPGRSYTPEDAPLSDYKALAETLGLRRAVVVQPSVYGCDNRALAAALAETALAPADLELRGVAAIETAMTDRDLEALHQAGVRAARYNLLFSDGCDKPPPEELARRVVPLGRHLEFCLDLKSDSQALSRLSALEVPCVIDHFGHLRAEEGSNQAALQSLLAWLKDVQGWLKLSAPYRCSGDAAGGYDNLRPLVEELVDQAPNRLLWGSDWPHPQAPFAPPALKTWLAKLESWIGKERLRRILVDNPVERYGFTE
jgi:predicted TIM-barrel fold metal-dependent hydrolase